MKIFKLSFALAFLILVISVDTYSQDRPCDHLTNPTAKRNCLQRVLDQRTREARVARERLERLDRSMRNACNAAAVMDQTATYVTRVAKICPRNRYCEAVKYSGTTWTSTRQVMSALTREKRNCESARRAYESARNR